MQLCLTEQLVLVIKAATEINLKSCFVLEKIGRKIAVITKSNQNPMANHSRCQRFGVLSSQGKPQYDRSALQQMVNMRMTMMPVTR